MCNISSLLKTELILAIVSDNLNMAATSIGAHKVAKGASASNGHPIEGASTEQPNGLTSDGLKKGDYIEFKSLPPGGPLNRWSHTLTNEHDFPGAQVSLVLRDIGR